MQRVNLASFPPLIVICLLGETLLVRAAPQTLGPGGGGAELCAAIHPLNADIMLLGQDVGGVLKSADGGNSWRHVNRGLAVPSLPTGALGIQELKFSPADPAVVFAATWGGVFRSTNTAESWTRVFPPGTNPVPDSPSASTVAVAADGRIVLAGTGDPFVQEAGRGLLRSTDGGLAFAPVANSGIPDEAIFGRIIIDLTTATPNLRVFAATSAGLYRSTDGGLTFNKINGGFAHD
ncbi:MAG: hypothetical protein HY674_12170, partial [Chloroflexi bacterium]|nr:hypothetical protein [Chloroflexota bacterium]